MITRYIQWMVVAAGLMLVSTSCNDWLDVTPESSFSREEMFSTEDGFVDALYANYRGMSEVTMYGRETLWGFNDVRAQCFDLQDNMYFYPVAQYDFESSRNKAFVATVWGQFYNRIASLNSLLENWKRRMLTS